MDDSSRAKLVASPRLRHADLANVRVEAADVARIESLLPLYRKASP